MTLLLNNSVFVHVPRTGGMWLRGVVSELGLIVMETTSDRWNHCSHSELPAALQSMPSFSFVRHPVTWITSRWRHSHKINSKAEYRFHGVHRVFDELVRPSLQDTIRRILKYRPGLVGHTFKEMTTGVTVLGRTREIPAVGISILNQLEGVQVTTDHFGIVNGTEPLHNEGVDSGLLQDFLASESVAMEIWKGACGV